MTINRLQNHYITTPASSHGKSMVESKNSKIVHGTGPKISKISIAEPETNEEDLSEFVNASFSVDSIKCVKLIPKRFKIMGFFRNPGNDVNIYVVSIFKGGKRNLIENYRCIAILSAVPKLFELLIFDSLFFHLKSSIAVVFLKAD
jgi:hypothetical protein